MFAVHQGKLLSTGRDNTIHVWALGMWEQVRVVRTCPRSSPVNAGSKLLCGGELEQDEGASDEDDSDNAKKGFLLVIDYEVMSC